MKEDVTDKEFEEMKKGTMNIANKIVSLFVEKRMIDADIIMTLSIVISSFINHNQYNVNEVMRELSRTVSVMKNCIKIEKKEE